MTADSRIDEFEHLFAGFRRATPELLAKRALLRRIDSKFLLTEEQALMVVAKLKEHYAVLPARGPTSDDEQLIASYRTRYFDTESLRCFHDHRRGRRPRQKIRIRHYEDRGVCYLEIKSKRSELISSKKRKAVPFVTSSMSSEDLEFVGEYSRLQALELVPAVSTDFRRTTLLGLDTNERITLDFDLDIGAAGSEQRERIGGIVILEVKQSPFSSHTPIMLALRAGGHRPTSASKYCTATAFTREGLRMNRLLPAIRQIERMRS